MAEFVGRDQSLKLHHLKMRKPPSLQTSQRVSFRYASSHSVIRTLGSLFSHRPFYQARVDMSVFWEYLLTAVNYLAQSVSSVAWVSAVAFLQVSAW